MFQKTHTLLPVLLVAGLASCGSSEETSADAPTPEQPTAATTPAAAPSAPAAAPAPALTPPAARAPDAVAARVGEHEILEADIETGVVQLVSAQMQGRPLPPAQMDQARAALRGQVLESLIDDHLLDQDAAAAGVEETTEDVVEALERNLANYLVQFDLERSDLEERIQAAQGMGLEEFIEMQSKDESIRRSMRQTKLLEGAYPERTAVSDEEIEVSYQENLEAAYTRPAQVRASHILIGTQQMTTPEEREGARKQAEELVVLARAPEADFAELARENSTGPSAPQGGDLGWFPREGAMVEPFSAAAFELELDGVSDVVETQFGYHVIQCTGRKEGGVLPLEQVSGSIRDQLEAQKLAEVRVDHVQKLRAEAEVEIVE